jgi:hypothetical protein
MDAMPTEAELSRLGYSRPWLDYGFLTPQQLREQLHIDDTDPEPDLDHYRAWTIDDWLDAREHLTASELEGVLWLLENDGDLKGLIINGLLRDDGKFELTEDQVDRIGVVAAGLGRTSAVERWRSRRRIRTEPWSEETLELLLTGFPAWEQSRLLIELDGLGVIPPDHLAIIAERGQSKRIRHEATQMLRRHA